MIYFTSVQDAAVKAQAAVAKTNANNELAQNKTNSFIFFFLTANRLVLTTFLTKFKYSRLNLTTSNKRWLEQA